MHWIRQSKHEIDSPSGNFRCLCTYSRAIGRSQNPGVSPAYLCRILGQWNILLLNLTSIVSWILFIVSSFSFVKKKNLKDDTSKRICETNGNEWDLHRFHESSLDVSTLIVTTWPFLTKERSKMRHIKKIVKPMEVKLRSKMSHWPKIPPQE